MRDQQQPQLEFEQRFRMYRTGFAYIGSSAVSNSVCICKQMELEGTEEMNNFP